MKEAKNRLRTGAKTLRLAALALSLGATTSAVADAIEWIGTGDFSTAANWNGGVVPSNNDIIFLENSVGKTVNIDDDCWVLTSWVRTGSDDSDTPLVFTGADGKTLNAYWAFSCADVENGKSAFAINSGTYNINHGDGTSYWVWGANAKLNAEINGGVLTFNRGLNMMWGGSQTLNLDVNGGNLTVSTDLVIGTNSGNSQGTVNIGDAESASAAVVSCGGAAENFVSLAEYTCTDTTIDVNLNANGELKAYNIIRRAPTGGTVNLNFNGGTLTALGVGTAGGLIGSGITVTVGANGGTIDTAGNAVTIASAITGTGTLRITGGGSVTFSADPTCPILAVAGTTVLNSSGERIGYNTWQGADGDYWNVASNWSLGVVPTADQIVEINDDHTILISGWNETDADACKVGALVVNGNVTFANAWKRLLVYGASGETAISGKGTLTLTSNTGLENYSSTGIQDITCGLAFGANDNHAWLGGSTYGWRVIGATTLNCAMQTDKPVTFSGSIVSDAGRINTQAQAVTITSSSITGTSLEINHASDSTAGSVSFATAPSCPLYVNGGETVSGNIGDVTFASGHTLALSGNTVNASSITSSGSLTVTGYGDITVSGAVNVTGTLDFSLNNFVDLQDSIVDTYTINLSAQSVNAGNITGIANITTTSGVTANGAAFYGSIKGTGGVAASGTTVLYGLNDFSGTLSVGQDASLEIVSSLEGISPTWRLDALEGDTETLEFTDGKVTKWTAQGGTCYFSNADSPMTTTTDYFGSDGTSRRAVLTNYGMLTSSFTDSRNLHPNTLIGAVRLVGYSGSGEILYKQNTSNWYIGRRTGGVRWCKMEGSKKEHFSGFWSNGVYGQASFDTETDMTLSILDFSRTSSAVEYLGGSAGNVAIGELVAFLNNPSHQTVKRVETYLANKWGISGKSIPSVPVVLGTGSVLDLGGTSQTVASLSGSGTVQNGTITVTEPISVTPGNVIKVPVGSTCSAADDGTIMITGTEYIMFANGVASVDGTFYSTVQAAVDDLIAGAVSGTLTIYVDGAAINLGSADATIDIALASGVTAPTVTANLPWVANYDPQTGAIVSERQAQTYVWTPGDSDTNWGSLSNWRIGEATPAELPSANDTVIFPANETQWTVVLETDVYATNVLVNSDMSFSGGQIHTGNIGGSGTITLNGNAGFHTYDQEKAKLEITNNLVIAGTGNKFQTQGSGSYMDGGTIDILGKVTGNGEISTVGKRSVFNIDGNWEEFKGTFKVVDDNVPRNGTILQHTYSSSEEAKWIVYNRSDNAFFGTTGTYKFGSLNGTVYQNYQSTAGVIIEVGALGLDDSLHGQFFSTKTYNRLPTYGFTLCKKGNGQLTFDGSEIGTLESNAGVLCITDKKSLITYLDDNNGTKTTEEAATSTYLTKIKFTGGTIKLDSTVDYDISGQIESTDASIIFDDDGLDREWATPLANTSLTKKGTGTLTLAVQTSALSISVDEGSVKVPSTDTMCTAASGTKRTTVGDYYVFEKMVIPSDTDGSVTINADDQTAADAIAEQYVVTPTVAQTAAGVESSYYKVVATETATPGTYALTVEFADEVVPVVSEETVNDTTVTFAVTNFKKGLYYGVAAGASPELSETDVKQLTPCTDEKTGVTLTADMPKDGVKYYKVVVSDTAE